MKIWWLPSARRRERRRVERIEESIARTRLTSAELVILVEQVRGHVVNLDKEIDAYLTRSSSRERV